MFLWRLIFVLNDIGISIVIALFPLALLCSMLLLRRHLSNVENFLVPVVEMPELIFF